MKVASLGYAVRERYLAIGLTGMSLDNILARLFNYRGLPLLSSGFYWLSVVPIRFMAISVGAIDAGLTRIPPGMEQASRLLGESRSGNLFPRTFTVIASGISDCFAGFADVMKVTGYFVLRPVNFETLQHLCMQKRREVRLP